MEILRKNIFLLLMMSVLISCSQIQTNYKHLKQELGIAKEQTQGKPAAAQTQEDPWQPCIDKLNMNAWDLDNWKMRRLTCQQALDWFQVSKAQNKDSSDIYAKRWIKSQFSPKQALSWTKLEIYNPGLAEIFVQHDLKPELLTKEWAYVFRNATTPSNGKYIRELKRFMLNKQDPMIAGPLVTLFDFTLEDKQKLDQSCKSYSTALYSDNPYNSDGKCYIQDVAKGLQILDRRNILFKVLNNSYIHGFNWGATSIAKLQFKSYDLPTEKGTIIFIAKGGKPFKYKSLSGMKTVATGEVIMWKKAPYYVP